MYSTEPRVTYRKNQLGEVICQLRFPEILAIGAKPPVDFQEAIRADYPQYSSRMESPAPKLTGVPGKMQLQNQPPVTNYQFVSADGRWRVNLTQKFIFDQDHYMPGKIAPILSAPALQTLHALAWSIFRDAITDELHDAMEPMD